MISLLLAVISFIFTVALHIVSISLKITIKTLKVSLKVGSKIVKKGAKTSKKVVKKTVNTTKKASKKVKNSISNNKNTEEKNVKDKINTKDEDNEELFSRSKALMKKLLSLELIHKTIHFLLNFFRGLFVLYVVYVFVLGIFVVTGSLALISSAGYVALAYETGNLDNNSFDITQDNTEEDGDTNVNIPPVANDGSISGKLETMGQWYVNHIPTYSDGYRGNQATKNAISYYNSIKGNNKKVQDDGPCFRYDCELLNDDKSKELKNRGARDDCTGFAAAFASYVSGVYISPSCSDDMLNGWSATKHGWSKMAFPGVDKLQPGDICVKHGHAEVFVDKEH